MISYFKKLAVTYKGLFSDKKFIITFLAAAGSLVGALIINYYASIYATESVSNSVTDIVLSNIPVYNVAVLFLVGPFIFWAFISIFMLSRPTSIPFALKSIAVFIIVRSIFISLTHLGPFPDEVSLAAAGSKISSFFEVRTNPNFLAFGSGGDLFFSGHTGLPFLLALVYWNYKPVRIFALATALFFGIIVLLGHLHYTIDVLSAFFITYGIYHICLRLFRPELSPSAPVRDSIL